jgi:hypothetical protein
MVGFLVCLTFSIWRPYAEETASLSCVLAIGAGFVAGCGSGGSSPTAVTTVDSTKPLNTLTAAETTQLCNDTSAYMEKVVSTASVCKQSAVMGVAVASPTSDADA